MSMKKWKRETAIRREKQKIALKMIREGFAVIVLAIFSNFRKIHSATTIQFTIRVQAQLIK